MGKGRRAKVAAGLGSFLGENMETHIVKDINRQYMVVSQNLRYLFGVGYHPTSLCKRLFGCSPGYRGFHPQPYH